MPSEARPRQHPIVNPELAADLLRRIIIAWQSQNDADLDAAIADARKLFEKP